MYSRKSEHPSTVDAKTWSDLEMDEVFARVDRTTRLAGRQYLYAAMWIDVDNISEPERRGLAAALFPLSGNNGHRLQLIGGCAPRVLNRIHYERRDERREG